MVTMDISETMKYLILLNCGLNQKNCFDPFTTSEREKMRELVQIVRRLRALNG